MYSKCIEMSKEDILKSFKNTPRTKVSDYNLDDIKPIKHLTPSDDDKSEDDIIFGYLKGFEFVYAELAVKDTNNVLYDMIISYSEKHNKCRIKPSNTSVFSGVWCKYNTYGVTSILFQLSDGSWFKKNLKFLGSRYSSCFTEDGTNLLLDGYKYRADTSNDDDRISELVNVSIKAIVPIFDVNDLAYTDIKRETEEINVLSNKLELLKSDFELKAGERYDTIGLGCDNLLMQSTFHPDPGFDFMVDNSKYRYFFSKDGVCVAHGDREINGSDYLVDQYDNIVHPTYKRNEELEINDE